MSSIFQNVGTVFIVLVLVFDAYLAWDFWRRYKADPHDEPWYMKAFHAAYDSLTVLMTKLATALWTIVALLDPLAEMVGGDTAKDFVHQWVGNPKFVAAILFGFTAVVFFSRMRSIVQGMGVGMTQAILKVQ